MSDSNDDVHGNAMGDKDNAPSDAASNSATDAASDATDEILTDGNVPEDADLSTDNGSSN